MFTETKTSIKKHLNTAARLLLSANDVDGANEAAIMAIEAGKIVEKFETVKNPNPSTRGKKKIRMS